MSNELDAVMSLLVIHAASLKVIRDEQQEKLAVASAARDEELKKFKEADAPWQRAMDAIWSLKTEEPESNAV